MASELPFEDRIFSGRDLLHLMDLEGIGVGATKHLVKQAELDHERHPDTYRALDGPARLIAWLKERENDMNAAPLDWANIARKIEEKYVN